MNHISLRRPRLAGGLAPLAVLLIAACGSSHSPSTHASTATTPAPATRSTSTAAHSSHSPSLGATHKKHSGSKPAKQGSSTTHSTTTASVPAPNPNPPAEPGCPKGVVPCVTKSTSFKPRGSPYIDINLEQAIARDQPAVKSAKVTCPSSREYPVHCTMTGSATVAGKLQPIKGTIKVLGVETSTRTYAYSLLYKPAHSG